MKFLKLHLLMCNMIRLLYTFNYDAFNQRYSKEKKFIPFEYFDFKLKSFTELSSENTLEYVTKKESILLEHDK